MGEEIHAHKSKQKHTGLQRRVHTWLELSDLDSHTHHTHWLFFRTQNLVQAVTQCDNTDTFQESERKTEKGRQSKVFKGGIEGKLDGKNKLHKKRRRKRGFLLGQINESRLMHVHMPSHCARAW